MKVIIGLLKLSLSFNNNAKINVLVKILKVFEAIVAIDKVLFVLNDLKDKILLKIDKQLCQHDHWREANHCVDKHFQIFSNAPKEFSEKERHG